MTFPTLAAELTLGFAIALAVSITTAPVGVSGAVFMVPAQLSLLGTASQAVTATNLLYNLIAIPGALLRYRSQAALWNRLARIMLIGTVPGMVVGVALRVTVLSASDAYLLVVAAVLGVLGAWLLARPVGDPSSGPRLDERKVALASLAVGVIGGIYGIGGGAILAPILAGAGFTLAEVAPAALLTTLATSVVGFASLIVLGSAGDSGFLPRWETGIALGLGGLLGGYIGAALQPRLPELLLRRLLGLLALAVAVLYAIRALH